MDRATILHRLALAQEKVARSVTYVANHPARVKRLERRGMDSYHAERAKGIGSISRPTALPCEQYRSAACATASLPARSCPPRSGGPSKCPSLAKILRTCRR